jgi:hypothetical protein
MRNSLIRRLAAAVLIAGVSLGVTATAASASTASPHLLHPQYECIRMCFL